MSNPNVTNPIPSTLHELLVELQFLGMIERGMKVNMMSKMSFVDANSWYDAFARRIYGEGRKSLVLYINKTVTRAIASIAEYHNTEFSRIILNTLSEAKIGIRNLSDTYQSDPHMVSEISVIIKNIDLQLEKHKDMLEGHERDNN
jgi:hypothetical protein